MVSVRFCFGLLLTAVLFSTYLTSCSQEGTREPELKNWSSMQDSAEHYNHQVVSTESQEIDDFIVRYHWTMNTTPTGLRYMIYRHGKGPAPREGNTVEISYDVRLLNGEHLLKSAMPKPYKLVLGKRDVVSGLEEGLQLMKQGDRARMILPSHLAYSLLGDLVSVPAGAALVIDVELLSVTTAK